MIVVKSGTKTTVLQLDWLLGLGSVSSKQIVITIENKAWDDYLKCSADLNFEIDFKVTVPYRLRPHRKWDLILLEKWIVFIHNRIIFQV